MMFFYYSKGEFPMENDEKSIFCQNNFYCNRSNSFLLRDEIQNLIIE